MKSGRTSKEGQLADLAVLSQDFFTVPDDAIAHTESVLTLLGGRPVHAAAEIADLAAPLPPAMPEWSPVRSFGGYPTRSYAAACRAHVAAPPHAEAALWGALGCSCWAF